MAAGITFKIDENAEGWRELQKTLAELRSGESYVKVGVIGALAAEEAGDSDSLEAWAGSALKSGGMTNGRLATIHEFGVPGRIPARPFIGGTFTLNRAKYIATLKVMVRGIYLGKVKALDALKVLGEKMASDIRNRMVDGAGIPPPNAPSTIARKLKKGAWNKKGRAAKASPRPLIDTGRLRNSVSYAVVLGSGERPAETLGQWADRMLKGPE